MVTSEEALKTLTMESGKDAKDVKAEEIEEKRLAMTTAKATLPKFTQTRVGMMIDDEEVPAEILTHTEEGTTDGIDLLAYIGYLHAALKEEIQTRKALEAGQEALEARITALEAK